MIENIETLLALHQQGTMLKASSMLRVSQSTVSKRITSLEQYFSKKLISKSGRRVVLTPEALKIVDKLGVLIGEIRELINEDIKEQKCVVGVSESILSSWGPKYIIPKFEKLNFAVELHCHRSPLVVDKVEAGEYDLGICSGRITTSRSLVSDVIHQEEMVLVSKGRFDKANIISIEKSSATWKSISSKLLKFNYDKIQYLESFFSIGQVAKSTKSIGLIPIGVARTMNFKATQIKSFKPKIYRPVQLIYKKSKLEQLKYNHLVNSFSV